MKLSIDVVFVFGASGLFAFLYALRIHVDYRIHILGETGGRLSPRYKGGLAIHFLLYWWFHLLALATSVETNERLISGLAQVSEWTWSQLTALARPETIVVFGIPAGPTCSSPRSPVRTRPVRA